jgi:DNA-binding transcriptional MerR regulator
LGFSLAEIKEMVEAEEVKLQLRAEYRPDSALSQKRTQLRKAIGVTERQHAVIGQKIAALTEMQAKLEERLETFRGWREHLDEHEVEAKPKVKAKA